MKNKRLVIGVLVALSLILGGTYVVSNNSHPVAFAHVDPPA